MSGVGDPIKRIQVAWTPLVHADLVIWTRIGTDCDDTARAEGRGELHVNWDGIEDLESAGKSLENMISGCTFENE